LQSEFDDEMIKLKDTNKKLHKELDELKDQIDNRELEINRIKNSKGS